MKAWIFVALAGVATLCTSCNAPAPAPPGGKAAPDAAAAESAIRETKKVADARAAALARGDVDGWLAAYTDDAVWIPPHSDEIAGKEIARARLKGIFEQATVEETRKEDEQSLLSDNWMLERGTYSIVATPKKGGEGNQDVGKYLTMWRKTGDGQWKIAYQIWTSQRSLPALAGGGSK